MAPADSSRRSPLRESWRGRTGAPLLVRCAGRRPPEGQVTVAGANSCRAPKADLDAGNKIILTGGPYSCYVLSIAGWRRADERRRTAVAPRKKGNRRIMTVFGLGSAFERVLAATRPFVRSGSAARRRPTQDEEGVGSYFFPSFGRNALINLDSGKWIEIFGRILTLFGRASCARWKRSEAN